MVEVAVLAAVLIVGMEIKTAMLEMEVHQLKQPLAVLHPMVMWAVLTLLHLQQKVLVLVGVAQARPETQIDSPELVETIEVVTAVTAFTFLPLLLMVLVVTLAEEAEAAEVIHPVIDKAVQAVKEVAV